MSNKSLQAITRQFDKVSLEKNRVLKRLQSLKEKEDKLVWDLKRYLKTQKNTILSHKQKPQ